LNEVILLGTGCPAPSHDRFGPSTLFMSQNVKFIIDAGSGVTQRLSECKIPPSEIDFVLITHLHSDHIVDLYQLFISGWHTGRNFPFKIYGPVGIKKYFEKILEAYEDELGLREKWEARPNVEGLKVEIHEINSESLISIEGIEISPIEVNHMPVEPAFGYKVTINNSKSLVYSGDTSYSKNLEEASKNVDLLIHELYTGLDFHPERMSEVTIENVKMYHSTAEQVGELARNANVKKLVLNHFVPPKFDEKDIFEKIQKLYKGETILGTDLLRIEF